MEMVLIITDNQLAKSRRLLRYSDVYEINIQFCIGQTTVYPDQTTVYPGQTTVDIEKGGVELQSFGGDFDFAIDRSIEYLKRITAKEPKDKTPKQKPLIECDFCDGVGTTEGGKYLETTCPKCEGKGFIK